MRFSNGTRAPCPEFWRPLNCDRNRPIMTMSIERKRSALQERVTTILRGQARYPYWSLATALLVLSFLYGAVSFLRKTSFDRRRLTSFSLPCKVISVGNITVGGTGKTPMTIHLAKLFQGSGFRVAVISRGYKGSRSQRGAVVSDGRRIFCGPGQAGDEPFLMAHLLDNIPIVIGKDRFAAGKTAVARFHPDVIIVDDGFQHRRLNRDLNLLLLDSQFPFGNGFFLPRGTLRESISATHRADAIILTRCSTDESQRHSGIANLGHPRPVFSTRHRTVLRDIVSAGQACHPRILKVAHTTRTPDLGNRRVFAYCGLGQNEQFFESLKSLGANLKGTMGFNDHHPYRTGDADQIIRAAQDSGSNCLATTEKDFVRMRNNQRFPMELLIFGIDIDFGPDSDRWRQFVSSVFKPGPHGQVADSGGTAAI